jgi:hypothetical protein
MSASSSTTSNFDSGLTAFEIDTATKPAEESGGGPETIRLRSWPTALPMFFSMDVSRWGPLALDVDPRAKVIQQQIRLTPERWIRSRGSEAGA